MTATLNFDRRFAEYNKDVLPEEKTPEVLDVVEDFMLRWGYSFRNLIGATLSAHHLGGPAGRAPDLILGIAGADYFEIVIRGKDGTACYGGWLAGTAPVEVSAENANGRPVLLATARDGSRVRHTFDPLAGYRPDPQVPGLEIGAVRRLAAAD